MVIIHIYEAIAILILFCYHQDTKYQKCEIEMNIFQPMGTCMLMGWGVVNYFL